MDAPDRGGHGAPRSGSGYALQGFTLVEVLFAMGLIAVLAAAAIPSSREALDRAQATAAARYLAGRMALARVEAVKRSAHIGLRFEDDGVGGIRFRTFVDGNRDGIRTKDIGAGVDRAIGDAVHLAALFRGAAIALVDRAGPGEPVRVGTSRILSFSPLGTTTSGTIYVRGRDGTQLGVRILGATGRTRVIRYVPDTDRWVDVAW